MSGVVASWNWFIIAVHRPVTISYLPRNKRLPPLPTTWLSRANNYAKLPVLGRIARILSILSTPFLTFTDAFLRYGATTHQKERERETRQHECTCCCCANRAFRSLSKSFRLMTYIVIFGMMDRDFLFRMVEIVVAILVTRVNILKNIIIDYPCTMFSTFFASTKRIGIILITR